MTGIEHNEAGGFSGHCYLDADFGTNLVAAARMPRPRTREAFLGGATCESRTNTSNSIAFEVSSKRRKGFPSESHVKRGDRVVGGRKELIEKLGRNDLCPCGSGRRF